MAAIPPRQPTETFTPSSMVGRPRKASLSSFPSSRSPSYTSLGNGRHVGRNSRFRVESNSSIQPPPSPSTSHQRNESSRSQAPRLQAQYPANASERHVEYILVASFDIDRGPIMEHQYPGAIGGDESMLAELMLPDQAHVRNQDWTIFFLHNDVEELDENEVMTGGEAHEKASSTAPKQSGATDVESVTRNADDHDHDHDHNHNDDHDQQDTCDDEMGDPPLIYVLNLVNTKQDTTAKRGAVVKAMAICTRHSFLHIYKPLLLLGLEEYFKTPTLETLESLYNAVNAMDLTLMPKLSHLERSILQSTDMKDMFVEKFDLMNQQRIAEETAAGIEAQPESPSKFSQDPQQRSQRYPLPRDTHEFETRVVYNSIPIPIKIPTAPSPETVGDFSIIKLIQAFAVPHAASPQPFMLHAHLTTSGAYTHPIIVLLNAIITEKRVIFLGHNRPSGEVAEAVLAACALASGGLLRGFTRFAFPYTDLSKIDDLLNITGFIAGVTNPTFANHPEWWDLLCDLPTGRMKISNRIEQAPVPNGVGYFQSQYPSYAPNSNGVGGGMPSSQSTSADPIGDVAFVDDILRSIAARHGESVIRLKWREYIHKFTRLAAAFEDLVYGASAILMGSAETDADAVALGLSGRGYVWADEVSKGRELGANVWRIEGWRNTRSYFSFIQDITTSWERRPIKSIDLGYQMDRLRILKLSREESARLYIVLQENIKTYEAICQLLTVTPESHAGLFYISLGLFHPDKPVREATTELLDRIRQTAVGKHFWATLSRLVKLAHERLKEARAKDERDDDGDED